MRHSRYLALVAWLCCNGGTLVHAVDHDESQRNSSSSQMKYGDYLRTRSASSETKSATSSTKFDPFAWPTSDVPGMNIYDILSYEQAHNFELKLSPSRTTPQPSSQPPSYLSPDLPASTQPSDTVADLSEPSPSTTLFPPTTFLTRTRLILAPLSSLSSNSTNSSLALIFKRKDWTPYLGNKNGWVGPGEAAKWLGMCKTNYMGGWMIKRTVGPFEDDEPATFLPPRLPPPSPADILMRYLPLAPWRAYVSHREQLVSRGKPPQGLPQHGAEDLDPYRNSEILPGMTGYFSGMAIYTDEKIYETAILSWYNGRTVPKNACGWTPPVFWPTTMDPALLPQKASKPRTMATKKLSNANGGVKITKGKAGTLPVRRRGQDGEGRRTVVGGKEWYFEEVEAQGDYWDVDPDDEEEYEDEETYDDGEVVEMPRWEGRAFEGTQPRSREAGAVTSADTHGRGGLPKATPAPWTA